MNAEDTLAKVELFSEMPRRDLGRLAKLAVMRGFKKGEPIVKEGESGIGFYVISEGRVEVVKGAGSESEVVLASLGPESFFGEMSFFENSPRSATVRAVEDTECLVLTRWDFQAEVNRPGSRIAIAMLPVLARRIRNLDQAATHH